MPFSAERTTRVSNRGLPNNCIGAISPLLLCVSMILSDCAKTAQPADQVIVDFGSVAWFNMLPMHNKGDGAIYLLPARCVSKCSSPDRAQFSAGPAMPKNVDPHNPRQWERVADKWLGDGIRHTIVSLPMKAPRVWTYATIINVYLSPEPYDRARLAGRNVYLIRGRCTDSQAQRIAQLPNLPNTEYEWSMPVAASWRSFLNRGYAVIVVHGSSKRAEWCGALDSANAHY